MYVPCFISLENLHVYSKTYVFSNTFEGFRPKCTFRGCLSKYRRTFIVYMFRRPPEGWSLMSDNALISGTGKVGIGRITCMCRYIDVNFSPCLRKPEINQSRAALEAITGFPLSSNLYMITPRHRNAFRITDSLYKDPPHKGPVM